MGNAAKRLGVLAQYPEPLIINVPDAADYIQGLGLSGIMGRQSDRQVKSNHGHHNHHDYQRFKRNKKTLKVSETFKV